MIEERKTERLPIVAANAPRCPECGSSRRAKFDGSTVFHYAGSNGGLQFNRVVQRWTTCLDCKTRYQVREHQFEPRRSADAEIRPDPSHGEG